MSIQTWVHCLSGQAKWIISTLKNGSDAVRCFLPRLHYCHLAANLGVVEIVVDLPATTSHVECTLQEGVAMAIPESLIRCSAGTENTEDLVDDLRQALTAIQCFLLPN